MNDNQKQSGFTLIEMVVSVGLFVVVALIVSVVFVSLAQSNRKAQALKLVMDNLNFTMDTMVINLKTGKNYQCKVGAEPCTEIGFDDLDGNQHSYSVENGQIKEDGVQLTASDVKIIYADFKVDKPVNARPLARIIIKGEAQSQTAAKTEFSIQTVVSQRNW